MEKGQCGKGLASILVGQAAALLAIPVNLVEVNVVVAFHPFNARIGIGVENVEHLGRFLAVGTENGQ